MRFNDLSEFDKGWVVALIEGEGHIGKHDKRDMIVIKMGDRDIIERYHSFTENTTKILPVEDNRKEHYSTMYVSKLNGAKARLLMVDIFPFMSERKQLQIQNVLLGVKDG